MATLLMIESWVQSTGLALPALIRDLGHRYVLLTRNPRVYTDTRATTHPVLRHADDVVVTETNDPDTTVRTAHDVARSRSVGGVLTTCDYYLETSARVAAALGLPGPPADAIGLATRKHLVRRALRDARIPDVDCVVAQYWPAARKAAARLGFPLVAKPVDANSGSGVRLVPDEEALERAFREITGPAVNTRDQPLARLIMLERVTDGPEISVEVAVGKADPVILAVTAKTVIGPDAVDGGGFVEAAHTVPASLPPATDAAVRSLVRRAVAAIGVQHCLAHVEIKLTPAGPRIVEVNPRQGGGYVFDLVRLTTGYHPLRHLIDLALGDGLRPVPPTATSAAVAFVIAPATGVLRGVSGAGTWADDERIVHWSMSAPGPVRRPGDNNDRIGHVLTADTHGHRAEQWATAAVRGLRLDIDGTTFPPIITGGGR